MPLCSPVVVDVGLFALFFLADLSDAADGVVLFCAFVLHAKPDTVLL